ncbi:MAG: type VII secretion-associated protein, partial [Mycobacterium sp.]|nr:type VII secretion-associated protein [Mycobacterium sp.]
ARDQRAGRAVVSYREVRGAREIGWVVLVDGATRIAIGCQGAAGSSDTVDEACDGAVRSAREITGTAAQR